MFTVAVLSMPFVVLAAIVTPLGAPVAVKLTAPANPFTRVMFAVAVPPPPWGTLAVVGLMANATLCDVLLNVAVTDSADVTVTVHVVFVPVQTPLALDQPANALLAAGVAVSVTLVPGANGDVQVPAQLIPAGFDVTVPVPVPASATAI